MPWAGLEQAGWGGRQRSVTPSCRSISMSSSKKGALLVSFPSGVDCEVTMPYIEALRPRRPLHRRVAIGSLRRHNIRHDDLRHRPRGPSTPRRHGAGDLHALGRCCAPPLPTFILIWRRRHYSKPLFCNELRWGYHHLPLEMRFVFLFSLPRIFLRHQVVQVLSRVDPHRFFQSWIMPL
jgi:hypothetical protein